MQKISTPDIRYSETKGESKKKLFLSNLVFHLTIYLNQIGQSTCISDIYDLLVSNALFLGHTIRKNDFLKKTNIETVETECSEDDIQRDTLFKYKKNV